MHAGLMARLGRFFEWVGKKGPDRGNLASPQAAAGQLKMCLAESRRTGKDCRNHLESKPPIFTMIPGQSPIELVAYYDEFAGYYPNCEMATKSWFVRNVRKDWIIFDCGANIGYYSILFSRLAMDGQVYAFEPTITYDMLLANLAHHRIKNVIPIRFALGNKTGLLEESIFRIWGSEPERGRYPFTTIDAFVEADNINRLDCIKIDVDSFDFEILQGAEKTLVKFNPFVMVELNHALIKRGHSNMQVLEWLARLGYSACVVFDHENFLLRRGSSFSEDAAHKLRCTVFFEQTTT